MGIVELNRDFLGQLIPVLVSAPEPTHEIPERTGDQEIFLNKAQALAEAGRIVGIQHPRERFGSQSLRDSPDEITVAELLEIEEIGSRRRPEAERVDGLAAKADDGPVIGMPINFEGLPGIGCKLPPRTSNEQFKGTSIFSRGRATSHGSGLRNQLSGCSCCQPLWMVCLKMPYS